jgi:hypothetical protein
MVRREFIEYMLQFPIEAVLRIMNFILCWGMNVQNSDIYYASNLLVLHIPSSH